MSLGRQAGSRKDVLQSASRSDQLETPFAGIADSEETDESLNFWPSAAPAASAVESAKTRHAAADCVSFRMYGIRAVSTEMCRLPSSATESGSQLAGPDRVLPWLCFVFPCCFPPPFGSSSSIRWQKLHVLRQANIVMLLKSCDYKTTR
jgi:hypothetical protein